MEQRALGQGLVVSALGLGCMGMSQSYGVPDEAESIATLHRAFELGVTLFDTADVYGDGANEVLVGAALASHRDHVVIATKFGNKRGVPQANGKPDYVRSACEMSLQRLGVDVIDLYYQHRVDPTVPVEETWGALSELVSEGKVRYLGISEAAVATLRRAHAVHPIAAAQYEYSLFTRDPESELMTALAELGIGLVAYSPMGRGMLSGRVVNGEFGAGDSRPHHPRFQPEHFDENRQLVARLEQVAARHRVTAAQLSLAWLLTQDDRIVPIPGTKRRSYLEENVAAADISLSAEDLVEIEAAIPKGAASGARYEPGQMARVNI